MSELYLIAHKVRGEPAFDIAERVECAECEGERRVMSSYDRVNCVECDSLGYWWIIPTSGHRAYLYYSAELPENFVCSVPDMPPDLPDHYRAKAEPKRTIDVSTLTQPKPFKMNRRI